MTIKPPHASVAQKLFVAKSSMEKSYFNSLILFSESALPRYESLHNLGGQSEIGDKATVTVSAKIVPVLEKFQLPDPFAGSLRTFFNFLSYHYYTSWLVPAVSLYVVSDISRPSATSTHACSWVRLYLIRLLNRQAIM